MRYFFLFLLSSCGCLTAVAQASEEMPQIYTLVEHAPEFPGGEQALYKFLRNNIKYPADDRIKNIQGKVIMGFVVWKNGSIRDVDVKKGVSIGLDAEAKRVIKKMPKWKPAMNKGEKVSCRYIVPISFRLE